MESGDGGIYLMKGEEPRNYGNDVLSNAGHKRRNRGNGGRT